MRSVLFAPQPVRLAAAVAIALAAPVTLRAQILCGDTLRRTVAGGARTDTLTFDAQPDEVVSIAVAGVPDPVVPRGSPTWELHDPNGQIVRTSRLDKQCSGACETLSLPRAGTYTIDVEIPNPGVTRDYDISLEALSQTANGLPNGPPQPTCLRGSAQSPDGTRPIPPVTLLTGTIEQWGETDTFTFEGDAGETAAIAVTALAGSHGDTFSPRWNLFDPQGQRVLTRLHARTCSRLCATEPLPTSGTYTIRIEDPGADALGGYTLFLVTAGATTTTSSVTTSSLTTSTTTSTSTTSTTTKTRPTTRFPLELGATIRRPVAGEGAGGAVAVRGSDLLLGAPHATSGVADAGAVYVIGIGGTPGSPGFGTLGATLRKPGAPAAGDAFGAAVAAVAGAVLVGAPGDDRAATNAGAAFVFMGLPDAVVLLAPTPTRGAAFGAAVAARGTELVIGAPGGTSGGRAYLMNAAGTTLRTYVDPRGGRAGDQLGFAVAASDDLVVIGAPGAHVLAGAALLFRGDAEGVALASGGAAGDDFGYAVATRGGQIFVGAPGDAGDAGRVVVFDAASGERLRVLRASSPATGDRFGAAIVVTDDAVLVGAPRAGGGAGAVYRFALDGTTAADTLRKPQPIAGDAFGVALAAMGSRPIVGVPGDDVGAIGGGAAYLYTAATLDAVFRHRLLPDAFGSTVAASDGTVVVGAPFDAGGTGAVYAFGGAGSATVANPVAASTRFGHAVAALGNEIVVGAPAAQNAAGAVHVFDGTTLRRTLTDPTPTAGDQFGFAVAAVDGDVVVGAPFTGALDAGAVYVMNAVTGTVRATLQKPTPTAGDFFGAALAVDGTQVLVGAPFDGTMAPNAGAAYLLDRSTAGLAQVYRSPAPAAVDLFGAAVALTASRAIVGAPLAGDTPAAGRVFVFDRATGALGFLLENPSPDAGDQFGAAVAAVGGDIAVGAPLDDGDMIDTGTVYLFDGTSGVLLETLPNPAQAAFDHFGAALAAGTPGLLIGTPGPARVYVFTVAAAASASSGIRTRATATSTRCGNGIVETGEACDDGNAVDADDCRNDCSGSFCCTFDPLAAARCDDGDPCTDDTLDPSVGCAHQDNGTCCPAQSTCPNGETCIPCAGCFLYPWDCCANRQRCLPLSPECTGTTCFPAASCECAGGLSCTDGAIPSRIVQRFERACEQLNRQATFSPQSVPSVRRDLLLTRASTRLARRAIRQAARVTRKLAAHGQVTRACRAALLQKIAIVKRAIPQGERLRRCVIERRVE